MTNETLTFLFTDIEGSTQLWEQHPEAMKLALARHDVILRQAIESHAGQVFKTVGDAFCAAFPSALDAVSAALDAQRAIGAESWGETVIKVRMGLHSGVAEQRDNDYFGPTLNRVARLMSAGHGGQTLLSAITRELAQTSLPEGVELRDMGERGLKDLVRPEHIYQLTAPGLQADFPPLKTLEAFRTNLPVQLTSFIGREKDISTVKGLMVEHRLTTLTGSGGTGKTRLSLQVAADLLDSFQDGVWFVEFAPLSDPALVPQTVLTTLGLREETGRPALEILTHYLQTKKVLLILDNCEHVIEAAAQFADAMLRACANLHLLVSSREALGISGEKAYHVRSLSTPKADALPSVETATEYESINLFVDRAKTVSSGFAITSTNVFAIAQICARLDGIPLAIELAAARIKLLKAEQIAERLDDRFRLLTGGSRTALPRQQTLRAMIDWSYDLLPESERVLLRRLSVFAGGWTLEAAETVCQGPGIDDYNVLDPLAQLVNKSLIVVDADDNTETRYRLLETIRQYAREKLSETGEGMAVRDAHLQYFLGLAERAEPELVGPQEPEWQKRLDDEFDNIRAALEWSIKRDTQIGLRLASSLYRFRQANVSHVMTNAIFREKANWLKQLLQQPTASSRNATRARALFVLSRCFSEPIATLQAYAEESLAIYKELEDESGIASVLFWLGMVLFAQDNYIKGRSLVFESLTLYRKLGDKLGVAETLQQLGYLVDKNDYLQAGTYLQESLRLYRTLEFSVGIADTLGCLGYIAQFAGDYDLASASLLEAFEIYRKIGQDAFWLKITLGEMALHQGKYQEARTYLEEVRSRQRKYENYDPFLTFHLGYVALRQGNQIYARSLFKEILKTHVVFGETISKVCALEGFASLAVAQEEPERAVQLFAWADFMREHIHDSRPPVEQTEVDRDLATIRANLDEATFVAAQEAGRAMSMDEAIALALETTHDE